MMRGAWCVNKMPGTGQKNLVKAKLVALCQALQIRSFPQSVAVIVFIHNNAQL